MSLRNRGRLLVVVGLCAGLAAAGCKKDSAGAKGDPDGDGADRPAQVEKNKRAAGSLDAPPMFAHIPADTPYVFASFQPFPDDYWKKMVEDWGPAMDDVFAMALAQPAEGDPGGEIGKAVIQEIRGKLTEKGIKSLGFATEPRFAFYGVGLSPVLRFELDSGKALKQAIARIEANAGARIPTRTKDGIEYYAIENPDLSIAVAIRDKELVAGFTFSGRLDDLLPYVLGTRKPKKSMADGGRLKKLASEYGFAGYGLGYVDAVRIGELVVKEAGSEMPSGCAGHIESTLQKVPRVVFGYDEVTAKSTSMTAMVEMTPAVAKKIKTLRASVPGVSTEFSTTPLFAVAGAFDLKAGVAIAKDFAQELQNLGKACAIDEVEQAGREMLTELDEPIPPELAGIRGGTLVALDANMGMSGIPTGIEGYAILGTDDPKRLVNLANTLGSSMGLEIKTDGKFHRQSLDIPFVPELHVAVKKQVIALAAGGKGLEQVKAALADKRDSPLIVFAYDYGRIMSMMGDSFGGLPGGPHADAFQKMAAAQAKMFGLFAMWAYASDRGLGIRIRMDMK